MTVRILESFTGYPDGTDASRRLFRAGETPDLPDAFGELIVAKGHAEVLPTSTSTESAHSREQG